MSNLLEKERWRLRECLPKRIDYLLSVNEMTFEEAHEQTGIYYGDLKRIVELGEMPSVPQLSAIATLFGITVDHLIGIDGWTGKTE